MKKRHPKRSDEEWMHLIQECRSSGLSDKCWCEEHHIATSNFYYQIRRLRKMACEIPEPARSSFTKKQEIVQLSFDDPISCPIQTGTSAIDAVSQTAVKIMAHGFQIEITNAASSEAVFHMLSALQRLC